MRLSSIVYQGLLSVLEPWSQNGHVIDEIPDKEEHDFQGLILHHTIIPTAPISWPHYRHICYEMISCNGATRRDCCGFTGQLILNHRLQPKQHFAQGLQ